MAEAMATYLRASIPRRFTILGQELLPFSLWHMECLLRFENGFVTPEAEVGLGDLLHGIFFCCQNYEQGQKSLADPKTLDHLSEWGELVGPSLCKLKKGKFVFEIDDKALMFAEYLREGSGRPELMPAEGEDARVPGAPLLQLLKLFLVEHMRLSIQQAMDYSFAMACHDFFAWHEQHGTAKIANEEEGQMLGEHDDATTSEEFLKKCMAALPGSKPIPYAKPKPNKRRKRNAV